MKKTILILSTITLLFGCENKITQVTKWISSHKKPIICRSLGTNMVNTTNYTLIDANGEIYLTRETSLVLPDTIKTINN